VLKDFSGANIKLLFQVVQGYLALNGHLCADVPLKNDSLNIVYFEANVKPTTDYILAVFHGLQNFEPNHGMHSMFLQKLCKSEKRRVINKIFILSSLYFWPSAAAYLVQSTQNVSGQVAVHLDSSLMMSSTSACSRGQARKTGNTKEHRAIASADVKRSFSKHRSHDSAQLTGFKW